MYLVRVHSIYYLTSREKENSNMSKKKMSPVITTIPIFGEYVDKTVCN